MKNLKFQKKELYAICQNYEKIYIYGAGRNAALVYHFLEKHEIDVEGFIVTEMTGNPETLLGHAVNTADKPSQDNDYMILVPVSEAGKVFKEICNHLTDNRIHNAYFFTKELLEDIRNEVASYRVRDLFNAGSYHFEEKAPVELGHSIFSMTREGIEYHWRFRNSAAEEQDINGIDDVFPEMSALEEFEAQYGKYHTFHAMAAEAGERESTGAVYMACSHVDKKGMHDSLPSWVIPIQVGAELTNRNICKVKDNIGENISERNRNYSECTALYWMWKNASKVDYIGLCHYRRHFDLEENGIRKIAASDLDVLVTAPTFVNETIGSFFSILTPKVDLQMMLKAIAKSCPEYIAIAEEFLASRFFPPCNLFIMKYDLFQEYAKFVFSVTFEIERLYDELGFFRGDRYMGFIVECLMGIFLMKNKERLKIGYTDMKFYS